MVAPRLLVGAARAGQRPAGRLRPGRRRSSRRWRCWPPPAGWPRSSPTGRPRSSGSTGFLDFFGGDLLGIPVLVWVFALVAVAGWILLNRTTFGRRTFAVGGNPEAARLAGIRVKRHTMMLYGLVGLCRGHRRRDDAWPAPRPARRPTASCTSWTPSPPWSIGGTLLSGGRGTIVGTVFGVLIFTTLTNVFTLNNLSISAQAIAKGVIIVVAVLLQQRIASPQRRRLDAWHRPHPRVHPHPQHPYRSRRIAMSSIHRRSWSAASRRRTSPALGCARAAARPTPRDGRRHRSSSRRRRREPRRQRRARREDRHRLLRPRRRPRLDGRDHQARQSPRRRSTPTSSWSWPRAPTTSTCRSARSRRSSTTASTPSCCCRSTARR